MRVGLLGGGVIARLFLEHAGRGEMGEAQIVAVAGRGPVSRGKSLAREFGVPHPGDFVLADTDGVIVVPAGFAVKVLADAERLTKKEIRIRRELGRGATLESVLRKYGHV